MAKAEYGQNRTAFIRLRLNAAERQALYEMARLETAPPSEVVRSLLRQAARERGVWPVIQQQQAEGVAS